MATTRRHFIKQSAGALSVGLMMPRILFARRGESQTGERHILVVVQLTGGNDGLNTVIPYKDSRYYTLRPNLGFKEAELKDDEGKSTIINSEFGLHPAMKEFKKLYDDGKAAIINGVGYGSATLSHGIATDVWHTANTSGSARLGWLGRYADQTLQGKPDFSAVSVGSSYMPKVFAAEKVAVPLVSRLGETSFVVNWGSERQNFSNTFKAIYKHEAPPGSFQGAITLAAREADTGGEGLQAAVQQYRSRVVYPETNPLAAAMKTVAVLAAGLPESYIFHVAYPCFFDTHAKQIGTDADGYRNKLAGIHALEMSRLSEATKLFHDDMNEQGLGDNYLLMTYSEFGRRPNENASSGTDHGTASNLFVVGNKVKGNDLYGLQPSLNVTDLDADGNVRFTTDFRSIYATVLDKWLGSDSRSILGGSFENIGFLR